MRSDKKWSVQPTVSIELKDCIYRLSYITDQPVKDVVEAICEHGLERKKVISHLSQNFRRTVRVDNTLYIGDIERIPVKKRIAVGRTERISTRVDGNMHETLKVLAYSLDCSIARACALLLDASVRDVEFIDEFVQNYLQKHVDYNRMKELKKVLKYINENNPYSEEVSWGSFLSYLVDEVKLNAEKIQDSVETFVINHWKK
ncbi:hypothetical protein QT711_03070 [Sporosarcina saromensis]|uniref:Uncharacterized protein n=1 Tax=Sporosarcina saromensis TaxID=359365 RepID=A0ABU4G5G9_9BACL|nr:hypothetical protein [Sporosarcina saromensis]MDW0112151.1 hypothetical protein [Sporosarcina saromensis]